MKTNKKSQQRKNYTIKLGVILRQQGLTQEVLASKMGCTRANLYLLFAGRRPNPNLAKRVAQELGYESWAELTSKEVRL